MSGDWRIAESVQRRRICALQYNDQSTPPAVSPGPVVLLAILDASGLKLYSHRGLRQQVSERDWAYINELILDLEDRSREFPAEVFQQLSNLSVGPLITGAVEWSEREAKDLCMEFDLCVCDQQDDHSVCSLA